jgi:Tfp pilus assembly protein FimT
VLETIVVLAVFGLIVVLAIPSYSRYVSGQRLRTAARRLSADLRVARQEAVTRRGPVLVLFASEDPRCGRDNGASYALATDTSALKRVCFDADIQWDPAAPRPLVFQSAGLPETGLSLTLRSAHTGRRHTVVVAAESGTVSTDAR